MIILENQNTTNNEVVTEGNTYKGEVTKVLGFGAFVRILPETEGLLHISQIAPVRIGAVSDILEEGSSVNVKCVEIDGDRIRLTMKEIEQDDSDVAQRLEKVIASGGVEAKPRQDRNRGGYRNDRGPREGGYRGNRDSRDSRDGNRDSRDGNRGGSRGGYRSDSRGDRNSSGENRGNSSGRRFNRT